VKRVYDRLLKRVLYRGALHCMRSRGIAGYIKRVVDCLALKRVQ